MKFTRNTTSTQATTQLPGNYQSTEQVQESVSVPTPTPSRTFIRKQPTQQAPAAPKSDTFKVAPKQQPNNTAQATHGTAEHVSAQGRTMKILPKFVNRSPKADFGSAVEFTSSAFTLSKRNSAGYRESMDGKMLLNFWTFDSQTNHMKNFIPTYMDMSEWLNVCHMITSGRLHEETAIAREKQAKGSYKYCSFIYQSNGGSYKPIFKLNGQPFGGQQGSPIATVFKITPAQKDGSWVISSEIYEGVQEATGLIAVKSGTKPLAKIQVLMTYSDLVRIAKMSEMAIQAYLINFSNQYNMD